MKKAGIHAVLVVAMCRMLAAELPDISTVDPDLEVPALGEGSPAAGKRVRQTLPTYRSTEVHHILYLPTDWKPGGRFPILVEFAGNGPYRNRFGDVSTGLVEGSRMGYGISGGKGYLWLCLPYLDGEGTKNVRSWWGSKPEYDPQPTIDYCVEAVKWIAKEYGGDSRRVVLCGFSRGAIACNYIGLHDDQIAGMWAAFVPYSHYDGVHSGWPFAGSDRASAIKRLQRLGERPQFICGEGRNAQETRRYLEEVGAGGQFTIRGTGFRNHSDAWLLRPSPVRAELRLWLALVLDR